MKVKYFSDTDTAHIEFTEKTVQETKEISENICQSLIKGTTHIKLYQTWLATCLKNNL